MRLWMVALLLVFLASLVSAAEPLSPLEEAYGVNEVTIRNQAEVDWVRENKYIIYDFFERKNHLVDMLGDRKLIEILKNERSRDSMGIDEANLTPYIEEVRNERLDEYEKSRSEPYQEQKNYFPDVNEQKKLVIEEKTMNKTERDGERIECVRKNLYGIYDPFRKVNKWVAWLSDDWLLKIMETESSVVPRKCRLS